MAKGNKINLYKDVLEMLDDGVAIGKVAKYTGMGGSTVDRFARMIKACRTNDWELLRTAAEHSQEVGRIACELTNTPLEMLNPLVKDEPTKQAQAPKIEATAATPMTVDSLVFNKILSEIQATNELLMQLMDVVIPKYCEDLQNAMNVDANTLHGKLSEIAISNNANTDVLFKELERNTGMIERINGQFKKKFN